MKTVLYLVTGVVAHSLMLHSAQALPTHYHGYRTPEVAAVAYRPPPVYYVPAPPYTPPVAYPGTDYTYTKR